MYKSEEEISAVSRLGAGYAWAQICDRKINTEAAAHFLEEKFGFPHVYTAAQVADMMFMVVGSIGFENQMVGKRGCAGLAKLYGRAGSEIPGLIE